MKKFLPLMILIMAFGISYGQKNSKISHHKLKHQLPFKNLRIKEADHTHTLDSVRSDYDITRYTYDSKGQLILEEYESFEDNPYDDVFKEKYEYTYDSNGDQVMEIDYEFDFDTQEWIPIYKYESTYGSEYIDIEFEWDIDNNEWVKSYKHVHTLNSNNLIEKYTRYYLEEDGVTWTEDLSHTYQYNASNQMISDTESGTMGTIVTNTYENGLLVETHRDLQGSQDVKTLYYYTQDNILSHYIELYEYEDTWYESKKYIFEVNNTITQSETALPYTDWYQDLFNVPISKIDIYNYSDNDWAYEYTYNYYYSPNAVTSTVNRLIGIVNVYPNPCNDIIVLPTSDYSDVLIYNALGNLVLEFNLMGRNSINVETLNKGMYTIELKNKNNSIERASFIKR